MRRIRWLFAALIALAGLWAAPADAQERRRVVVLEVAGPGGERITRQLDLLVERRHTTITGARFSRTSREMSATERTDENIARVARNLAIDGVVVGEVVERGDSYRLTVRLREGRTGRFVQTIAVRLETPELTRAAARQIWRMIMPAIDELTPVAIVPDDEAEKATPTPPDDLDVGDAGRERPEPTQEPKPSPDAEPSGEASAARSHGEDAENPLAPASPEPEPETTSAAARAPSDLPPIELYGGLSVSNRALSFSHEPGLDEPPQGYAGAVVPGAFLRAELYPLAFSRADAVSRFGATVMVDHVLRIDSEVRYQGTSTSLPTAQSRASAGLVYRQALGDGDGLVLKGSLMLSTLSFRIDRSPSPIDIDVPDVSYTYLDPGVWARYPLGDVSLYGELRTMLVLSTGEIQQLDQYGTARVLGLDLDLGLEYAFSDELSARGGFRYTGISHAFSGDGALTDRGGAAAIDVVGAHDRYAGGYVQVGYAF